MSTVVEIKEAIARLSAEQYAELLSELMDFPEDDWDRAMKADAASGRLDIIDQQIARTAAGDQLVPLDIVLRDGE
jgi:predicted nucleic acid-binding protein